MKIAILVPNFVGFDGSARVAHLQAAEFIAKGYDVTVITLASDSTLTGCRVISFGMPSNLTFQRIYRLLSLVDIAKTVKIVNLLKDFDKVIAHLYPMTWYAYLAKKINRTCEYIFWFHGLEEPIVFKRFYEQLYMKLQILLTKISISNANEIVSVSQFGQKKAYDFFSRESRVVPNKVDLNRFCKMVDGSQVRMQFGLGASPTILYVGRIVPQKGIDMLIQSFYEVKKVIRNAKLLIVGTAPFDYYIRALKSISDESVIFAGYIAPERMPDVYAASNLYATCSLWENHNLPVIEAKACGKPVVTFDIDAFKNVLSEKDRLVPSRDIKGFADACIQILKLLNKGNIDYENMSNL